MPVDAFIHLDTVRCITESDGSGHSEPYVWPLLLWSDSALISSNQIIGATALGPVQGSRVVIKNGIEQGDQVSIPAIQRSLIHRFEDNLTLRTVGIVVAMLESDETPDKTVRAAYNAFVRELPLALADFIRANLRAPETDAETQSIADLVSPKVEQAGADTLSAWEKFKVAIGSLNLDDQMGFATHFVDVVDGMPPSSFTLQFGVGSNNHYEIDGRFELRQPPPPDPCLAERDRVQAAQSAVDGLHAMIHGLREELQHASPSQKPGILKMIRQIRQEELPPAEAELAAARDALASCRLVFIGDLHPVDRHPVFHDR